jgi:hypothetical protein
MAFTIKQGDTAPALRVTLQRSNGNPVDLSTVDSVEFSLEDGDNEQIIQDDLSGAVSIINASEGLLQYSWEPGDTDIIGQKRAEFTLEFQSGEIETFPNSGFIIISIQETT